MALHSCFKSHRRRSIRSESRGRTHGHDSGSHSCRRGVGETRKWRVCRYCTKFNMLCPELLNCFPVFREGKHGRFYILYNDLRSMLPRSREREASRGLGRTPRMMDPCLSVLVSHFVVVLIPWLINSYPRCHPASSWLRNCV